MLVLLDQGGCPVKVIVGLRARVGARLQSGRLDTALAGGASPDATVGLALRARLLERTTTRRALARSAQRVLAAARADQVSVRTALQVRREQVWACRAEFTELIERLLAAGPVSPQGMAQVTALLGNAGSPVYHRASTENLRAAVRSATAALNIDQISGCCT